MTYSVATEIATCGALALCRRQLRFYPFTLSQDAVVNLRPNRYGPLNSVSLAPRNAIGELTVIPLERWRVFAGKNLPNP